MVGDLRARRAPLGPWVRRVLAGASGLDPLSECFLFATARAEHVRRVIRPALDRGAVVLCDRYADSTVAYQGHGRGVPLELVAEVNRLATDGLVPDLTLVLDLDVAEGLRRARGRAESWTPSSSWARRSTSGCARDIARSTSGSRGGSS